MRRAFLLLGLSITNFAAADMNSVMLDIAPRNQWEANFGYCGEVSLISAGLYYGQYISQYDARAIASQNTPQNKAESQLLLGVNDQYAAKQMHLSSIEWDGSGGQPTTEFLAWVKQMIVSGYPVSIGILMNQYLFYGQKNAAAGDTDYDHIVPVYGVGSSQPLGDPSYYADDVIYFSDNGLWTPKGNVPIYLFDYAFGIFQQDRNQANAASASVYSLSTQGSGFGIAITGVTDPNGETLPVSLKTSINYEPAIQNGATSRPAPIPVTLTITLSNLEPGVSYKLYRYSQFGSVPDANFNASASQAQESWDVEISSGTTYEMTEQIQSDEMAIYRAVRASAP